MINLWRCSLNIFVFLLVRSCFLITPIKCLKGHKSLGSLIAFYGQTDGWTLVGIIRQRQHFVNFQQGAAEKKNRISPFCWLGWVDLLPCVKHIYCFLRDKRVLTLKPLSSEPKRVSNLLTSKNPKIPDDEKTDEIIQLFSRPDMTWIDLIWPNLTYCIAFSILAIFLFLSECLSFILQCSLLSIRLSHCLLVLPHSQNIVVFILLQCDPNIFSNRLFPRVAQSLHGTKPSNQYWH